MKIYYKPTGELLGELLDNGEMILLVGPDVWVANTTFHPINVKCFVDEDGNSFSFRKLLAMSQELKEEQND